jgi:hypothetical protein
MLNSKITSVIIFFAALNISININAQPTFQKIIGSEGFEKGSTVILLEDGSIIITGETESYGLTERDMLLVKTDSLGNILWSKSYGGSEREVANDIVQTFDKGLLMIAEKYQPNKAEGEFLTALKTDATGKLIWKKIYDEGGNETEGFSLQRTNDNNYIIAGMTKSMNVVSNTFFTMRAEDQSVYLLKIDENGNKIWSRKFSYGDDNISSTATSVIVASDGSYLVAGNIAKEGKTDKKIEKPAQQISMQDVRSMLLAKVKPNGNLQWAMEYESNQIMMGFTVIEKKEGGYVVMGNTTTSKDNMDIFILSLQADGTIQWAKTYGGLKFESAADIIQLSDGGFVATSITESYGNGNSDILLFKIDPKGNILWSKTIGGKNEDFPSKIALADNGIILAGTTASYNSQSFDVVLVKIDWDGNSNCSTTGITLGSKNFTPAFKKLSKSSMIKVEQGVLPPNIKKTTTENIKEFNREIKVKSICK